MKQGYGENKILSVVLTDESAMVVLFVCCYRLRDFVGSLFQHDNCYYIFNLVACELAYREAICGRYIPGTLLPTGMII